MMWKFWTVPLPQVPKARELWKRALESRGQKFLDEKPSLMLVESIVVAAPTFFDARHFARSALKTDVLRDAPVLDRTDVELRFLGDDYIHGGTPLARRLQLRRRVAGDDWGGWEEAS